MKGRYKSREKEMWEVMRRRAKGRVKGRYESKLDGEGDVRGAGDVDRPGVRQGEPHADDLGGGNEETK